MNMWKFVQFRSFLQNKQRCSRKRFVLDLKNSEFYPPEGHSFTSVALDNRNISCFFFGGARHDACAEWDLQNSVIKVDIKVESEDVNITNISACKTSGATLSPLQGSQILNLSSSAKNLHFLIWGGYNLKYLQTENELFVIRSCDTSDTLAVTLYKDASVDLKVPGESYMQGVAPSGRTGHTLTLISNEYALLFGGVTFPNRYSASPFGSKFMHKGSSDVAHVLRLNDLRWKYSKELEFLQCRAFHSAVRVENFNGKDSVVITGGVLYEESVAVSRAPIESVLVINVVNFIGGFPELSCFNVHFSSGGLHYLSAHSSCVCDKKMYIFGGYSQRSQIIDEKPDESSDLIVFDLCAERVIGEFHADMSFTGHSCLFLDKDCLLFCGGKYKRMLMYTIKPLLPSACDLEENCVIAESYELSIGWIKCDFCKKWFHQFCLKLIVVPKGKYMCPECQKSKPASKKQKLL